MKSKIVALSKNEEFKKLLKKKKISNKFVTIFFGNLTNKNNKKLNISFVTKKKIGNAVKRNKIKRQLRNIMNDAIKKIAIKLNYSYVVIAKPTMLNNEFKNIKETLGIARGNTVRARNVAKDIWAGLKNVVGGEISEYTRLQAQSREQAISRMIENAKSMNADAVINVRITTSMIMQGCSEIMAYGTAVKLD